MRCKMNPMIVCLGMSLSKVVVRIESFDHDSMSITLGTTKITINGVEASYHTHKSMRGYFFVVIDPITGDIISNNGFDTYGDIDEVSIYILINSFFVLFGPTALPCLLHITKQKTGGVFSRFVLSEKALGVCTTKMCLFFRYIV